MRSSRMHLIWRRRSVRNVADTRVRTSRKDRALLAKLQADAAQLVLPAAEATDRPATDG